MNIGFLKEREAFRTSVKIEVSIGFFLIKKNFIKNISFKLVTLSVTCVSAAYVSRDAPNTVSQQIKSQTRNNVPSGYMTPTCMHRQVVCECVCVCVHEHEQYTTD